MAPVYPPAAWKPRGSALGYYVGCMYRAAFDRAIHEALVTLKAEDLEAVTEARKSSPYADLGTCIHWRTQVGLNCIWGEGTAESHRPTLEQYNNAATLFGSDTKLLNNQISKAGLLAASHLAGYQFTAEVVVDTPYISGHIDFVSFDGSWLVDLKTTAKPPIGNKAKHEHIVQVLIYCAALRDMGLPLPKKITILYVDSLNAAWAHPIHLDLTLDALVEYMDQCVDYAKFLLGASLFAAATPQVGAACENWCPYTALCRDRIYAAMSSGIVTTPKPIKIKGPLT